MSTKAGELQIAIIDELLADHTHDETVAILNQRGLTGGWGKPFTVPSLTQLCKNRGIPDLRDRLHAAGMLTLDEIAGQLGVTPATVKTWHRRGDSPAGASTDAAPTSMSPARPAPQTAAAAPGARPPSPPKPTITTHWGIHLSGVDAPQCVLADSRATETFTPPLWS